MAAGQDNWQRQVTERSAAASFPGPWALSLTMPATAGTLLNGRQCRERRAAEEELRPGICVSLRQRNGAPAKVGHRRAGLKRRRKQAPAQRAPLPQRMAKAWRARAGRRAIEWRKGTFPKRSMPPGRTVPGSPQRGYGRERDAVRGLPQRAVRACTAAGAEAAWPDQ